MSRNNSSSGTLFWGVVALVILGLAGLLVGLMRPTAPHPEAMAAEQASPVAAAEPEGSRDRSDLDAVTADAQPAEAASDVEHERDASREAEKHGHAHGSKHANFDKRSLPLWELTGPQQGALEALRRRVPGVDVQFDPVTGSANHVMAAGRFLTGPITAGEDPNATLKRFVDENAALFGHGSEAVAQGVRVMREDVAAHNGMRSVVWQQEVDGVPVYNTILRASL
ncbi:MAG: hypothetical protein RLZZ142_2823, partial [Verrucomicrobiota bacterium]